MLRRTRAVAATALLAMTGCGQGEPMTPTPTFVERTQPSRQPAEGLPPLLVLLHGIGANEDDLFPLAHEVDPRFTVVSLRAPRPYHGGWAWFDIQFRSSARIVPDVAQAKATLADLVRWLGAAPERLGTDPEKTFLLGFSQGAMMSLGLLVTVPERLAGVVALSGRAPGELFGAPPNPDAVARVPLFVAHGTHDDVLPVDNGREIQQGFGSRLQDFTYREFPVGHGISDDELRTVDAWLSNHLGNR
jgi:phospholipase/carboxylesterase